MTQTTLVDASSPVPTLTAYVGADIHDGGRLHQHQALLVEGDKFKGLCAADGLPADTRKIEIDGGVLAPGLVDLQVNGGGGVLFNHAPCLQTLRTLSSAHRLLGTTTLLPTLITDTPQKTAAAIGAVEDAVAEQVDGIAGLHLEGPHLDVRRKGAHDPQLIRPLEETDLALLLDAAERLPLLKVTVAPASVSAAHVSRLCEAGIVVAVGHSDASYDEAGELFDAGATLATHLFNAMSPLSSRDPGVVGAALLNESVACGLIADGVHVDFNTVQLALRAKAGKGEIYLVSDAMAVAGASLQQFELGDRTIFRHRSDNTDGAPSGMLNAPCLRLEDGTLAGADLDLVTAIRNMITATDCSTEQVLRMATSIPAVQIGLQSSAGFIGSGRRADFIWIDNDWQLRGIWLAGIEQLNS